MFKEQHYEELFYHQQCGGPSPTATHLHQNALRPVNVSGNAPERFKRTLNRFLKVLKRLRACQCRNIDLVCKWEQPSPSQALLALVSLLRASDERDPCDQCCCRAGERILWIILQTFWRPSLKPFGDLNSCLELLYVWLITRKGNGERVGFCPVTEGQKGFYGYYLLFLFI